MQAQPKTNFHSTLDHLIHKFQMSRPFQNSENAGSRNSSVGPKPQQVEGQSSLTLAEVDFKLTPTP